MKYFISDEKNTRNYEKDLHAMEQRNPFSQPPVVTHTQIHNNNKREN